MGSESTGSDASGRGDGRPLADSGWRGSRIADFRKLSGPQRIREMQARGFLSAEDAAALVSGDHLLSPAAADRMIENVIGVVGLPVGIGLNFLINGRDYLIPLAVEEPSIVAALSAAAKVARLGGGFRTTSTDPVLIGQVQVVSPEDPDAAIAAVLANEAQILSLANSLHPKMAARGGGARAIEVHRHVAPTSGATMIVVHLLVDTRDAMGANLVNTMCEGVASLIESLTRGKVFLRILSNLTDRARATAEVRIPVQNLAGKGFTGEQVRDGIVLANDFARVDPYRAATHNKGIMNGIDPVAVATGNDWRAIEAAAHAWAARDGQYRALTEWSVGDDGELVGRLEMPLKVGIVGGSLQANPTVAINQRILDVGSATELAEIMVAVGLAQNFSALKALSTEGIQQGHMTLHARSVASTAGAPAEIFEAVVEALIESGEIKVWKAQEIIAALSTPEGAAADAAEPSPVTERVSAHAKVILFGEHAVVYGQPALAAPIPLAIEARVLASHDGPVLLIPRWGIELRMRSLEGSPSGLARMLADLLDELDLGDRSMTIEVFPHVPRAMGLGASAALAVALVRALARHFGLDLSDERVNALAFRCEQAAHGTPSGVDNTIATYGRMMLYQRVDDRPVFEDVRPGVPVPLLIVASAQESLTATTVAEVRAARARAPAMHERIFAEIGRIARDGVAAMRVGDLGALGMLMNLNHGLLNALQLSTPEIETIVRVARQAGALGAKLTGGGGGGAVVVLCPDGGAGRERIAAALRAEAYAPLEVTLE